MSSSNILSVQDIARVCHEVNRAYCAGIGDESQVSWDEAPAWQKAPVVAGVRAVIYNPDLAASASHDSWLAHKVSDGWVYGETKDPDATPPTHPCIVPYDDLPEEQKMKDKLFIATVKALCV